MKFLKSHWLGILAILTVFGVLLYDLAPDYSFMNKAADSMGYIYSAKYLYPSYHTSPPLYLLVSHLLITLVPIGTDAWRMGLLSVFSTAIACVFLYLIINQQTKNKIFASLGVIMYGLSALVMSQSVIIQTYPVTCMLATGVYYFALNKRWKLMGLFMGMGLAVHLLMGIVFGVSFAAFKDYRKNWKALLITFAFGIFYLYIPLTHRPPYMWFPDPTKTNIIWAIITNLVSVISTLIGQLSVYALPKRLLDTSLLLLVSCGVVAIVPIIYYFKTEKKLLGNYLFWMSFCPIVLFVSELDMNTFDYTMLALPYLTIATFLGLDRCVHKATDTGKYYMTGQALIALVIVSVITFGAYNSIYFSMGKVTDPQLSASKLYREEFPKIPDKAIFLPAYAWEWEAIYLYNADTGKHIYPICADMMNSEMYREQLQKDGVKLVYGTHENLSRRAQETAMSVIRLNDNVWTTVSTDPPTIASKVVNADHNEKYVVTSSDAIIEQIKRSPQIEWKPYNPYDIMTTSIMVTEWRNVVFSTWSVGYFANWLILGLIINHFLFRKKKVEGEAAWNSKTPLIK